VTHDIEAGTSHPAHFPLVGPPWCDDPQGTRRAGHRPYARRRISSGVPKLTGSIWDAHSEILVDDLLCGVGSRTHVDKNASSLKKDEFSLSSSTVESYCHKSPMVRKSVCGFLLDVAI
jgi:hypothetical protein